MEQILITRASGAVELINKTETLTVITKAEHRKALLGEDVVVMSIDSAIDRGFSVGDSIKLFGDNSYRINQLPKVTKLSQRQFQYELVFEGIQYDLLRASYRNEDASSFNTSADFVLVGDIEMYLNVLINNANRVFGANKWTLGTFPSGTETKNLLFNNENCLSVLQRICTEYDYQFVFTETSTQKILHVKKTGAELDFNFQYGKAKGLYQLSREKVESKNIVNKLFVYGSTKNIPSNYKNYSERLRLGAADDETVLVATDSLSAFGIFESTQIFEEVFPHRTGTISAINTSNRYEFMDSLMNFDLNEVDTNGNTKWLIEGNKAKIHFNTGNLAGYEFEISKYVHATRTFTLNPIIDPKGLSLPSTAESAFYIGVSDKYILLDIVMPDAYVTAAEVELEAKATTYLQQYKVPQVQYGLDIDSAFLQSKTSNLNIFELCDTVNVEDSDLGINSRIKIISFTRDVLNPFSYKLAISDVADTSVLRGLINDSSTIKKVIERKGILDPTKNKNDANITNQVISVTKGVLTSNDGLTIGNRAYDTLTEVLGRMGVRNNNNFLGQFSMGNLTQDIVFKFPNNAVSGEVKINDWNYLLNKPTTFSPSVHTHLISDVTNLAESLAQKQTLNANLSAISPLTGAGFLKRAANGGWSLDSTQYLTGNQSIAITGDATGSGTNSIALTLADTGVTAGIYRSVTADAKGRILGGTNPTTISEYEISDFWQQTLEGNFTPLNETIGAYDNLRVIAEKTQGQLNSKQGKIDTYYGYDESLYNGILVSDGGFLNWRVLDTSAISNFSPSVLSTPLTGLVAGSNTPIVATNTILGAFQNLQKQISEFKIGSIDVSGLWTFSTVPQSTADATLGNQLVRYSQVQALLAGGFSVSTSCKLAFDTNQTLLGAKTQAGYTTTTNDYALFYAQTTASQNGIYKFDGTNWTRPSENDADNEIRGKGHLITLGTFANTQFVNTNSSIITIGTTAITYNQWFGAETDPIWTSFKNGNSITNTSVANWNSAYSWSNHATVGYVKDTTDQSIAGTKTFTKSLKILAGTGTEYLQFSNVFDSYVDVVQGGNLTWYLKKSAGSGYFAMAQGGSASKTFAVFKNGLRLEQNNVAITNPTEILEIVGNFDITGNIKMNGSIGGDHYFLKSNGESQLWSRMNVGEIEDISTTYLSISAAQGGYQSKFNGTGFVKYNATTGTTSYDNAQYLSTQNGTEIVNSEGELGFFLFGNSAKTIKEAFIFTNPDTGIIGVHGFGLSGDVRTQYGLQIDKDTNLYRLKSDGTRVRLLTTDDALTGGTTTWNGGFVSNNIKFGGLTSLIWGEPSTVSDTNYGSKIQWGLNLTSQTGVSGHVGLLIESKQSIAISATDIVKIDGNKIFLKNIELNMTKVAQLIGI